MDLRRMMIEQQRQLEQTELRRNKEYVPALAAAILSRGEDPRKLHPQGGTKIEEVPVEAIQRASIAREKMRQDDGSVTTVTTTKTQRRPSSYAPSSEGGGNRTSSVVGLNSALKSDTTFAASSSSSSVGDVRQGNAGAEGGFVTTTTTYVTEQRGLAPQEVSKTVKTTIDGHSQRRGGEKGEEEGAARKERQPEENEREEKGTLEESEFLRKNNIHIPPGTLPETKTVTRKLEPDGKEIITTVETFVVGEGTVQDPKTTYTRTTTETFYFDEDEQLESIKMAAIEKEKEEKKLLQNNYNKSFLQQQPQQPQPRQQYQQPQPQQYQQPQPQQYQQPHPQQYQQPQPQQYQQPQPQQYQQPQPQQLQPPQPQQYQQPKQSFISAAPSTYPYHLPPPMPPSRLQQQHPGYTLPLEDQPVRGSSKDGINKDLIAYPATVFEDNYTENSVVTKTRDLPHGGKEQIVTDTVVEKLPDGMKKTTTKTTRHVTYPDGFEESESKIVISKSSGKAASPAGTSPEQDVFLPSIRKISPLKVVNDNSIPPFTRQPVPVCPYTGYHSATSAAATSTYTQPVTTASFVSKSTNTSDISETQGSVVTSADPTSTLPFTKSFPALTQTAVVSSKGPPMTTEEAKKLLSDQNKPSSNPSVQSTINANKYFNVISATHAALRDETKPVIKPNSTTYSSTSNSPSERLNLTDSNSSSTTFSINKFTSVNNNLNKGVNKQERKVSFSEATTSSPSASVSPALSVYVPQQARLQPSSVSSQPSQPPVRSNYATATSASAPVPPSVSSATGFNVNYDDSFYKYGKTFYKTEECDRYEPSTSGYIRQEDNAANPPSSSSSTLKSMMDDRNKVIAEAERKKVEGEPLRQAAFKAIERMYGVKYT